MANGLVRSRGKGENLTAKVELLKKHAGKGTMINEYKERVDFGEIIGEYYDINSNHYLSTSKGIIHYSNTGAHIVPAAP